MILTVDIGNSRIKWAQWQADSIVDHGAAAYAPAGLVKVLDEMFSTVAQPSAVYALCVAGDTVRQILSDWVNQHWNMVAVFLKTQQRFRHIENAYDDPAQHGADRWAGLVAGVQGYPGLPLCVIGAGTAITFDLVAQTGQHLGGYILPSISIMHKCLLSNTANLKAVPPELSTDFRAMMQQVPVNTNDAVTSGLHLMLQAGVREICMNARHRLGGEMQVLVTGGFAETMLGYPDMPEMHYHPHLVMQGLYSIMSGS